MISASELMKKAFEFPFCPTEGCEIVLDFQEEGGVYNCPDCGEITPVWKSYLSVDDLVSWFIEANKEIEKDGFMFTLKSGKEILNQGKLQGAQARAFREIVEAVKEVQEE